MYLKSRTAAWLVSSAILLAIGPADGQAQSKTVDTALIDEFIQTALKADNYLETATGPELTQLRRLMDDVINELQTREGILQFRRSDDLATIRNLIDIASSDDGALRRPAASILYSVVDNTTLCGVLDKLYLPMSQLNDSARLNLLGIVDVVAHYPFYENINWIRDTLDYNKNLIRGLANFENTADRINQIEVTLANPDKHALTKKDQHLQQVFKGHGVYEDCLGLDNID
jgi:hypothetical protein